MATSLLVELTNRAVPLNVTILKDGALTGASPTVALRDGSTSNRYLDWNDHILKTAGWTTKYTPLTETENGHYQTTVDLTRIPNLVAGGSLVAEYTVVEDGELWSDHDVLLLTSTESSIEMLQRLILSLSPTIIPGPTGRAHPTTVPMILGAKKTTRR